MRERFRCGFVGGHAGRTEPVRREIDVLRVAFLARVQECGQLGMGADLDCCQVVPSESGRRSTIVESRAHLH